MKTEFVRNLTKFFRRTTDKEIEAMWLSAYLRHLVGAVQKMAETGLLPDGDSINEPTRLWAEEWAKLLKGKGRIL